MMYAQPENQARRIHATLRAENFKSCIIGTRVNELIVSRLIEGALEAIERHGGQRQEQTVVLVPGALEMPVVAKKAAFSGQFDALIVVGAVIKGTTDHYDHVSSSAVQGISRLAYESGIAVGNGILTLHSLEQALERSGAQMGNMGYNAALAALDVWSVLQKLSPAQNAL